MRVVIVFKEKIIFIICESASLSKINVVPSPNTHVYTLYLIGPYELVSMSLAENGNDVKSYSICMWVGNVNPFLAGLSYNLQTKANSHSTMQRRQFV